MEALLQIHTFNKIKRCRVMGSDNGAMDDTEGKNLK